MNAYEKWAAEETARRVNANDTGFHATPGNVVGNKVAYKRHGSLPSATTLFVSFITLPFVMLLIIVASAYVRSVMGW